MKKHLKKIFLLLIIATPSIHAEWLAYTYLGTISGVDFHYRKTSDVESQNVQFKVTNTNTMTAKIKISDINFYCVRDNVTEVQKSISVRLKSSEEVTPKTFENVCQNFGGMDYLSVSIDARVRRN